MTHPHGLTRQDVAHLEAHVPVEFAMQVTDTIRATVKTEAFEQNGTLMACGIVLRYSNGDPGSSLVEIISPKPPTPPMTEPTWLGAVVMTIKGVAVRAQGNFSPTWELNGCMWAWSALLSELHPRPLTPAERRDLGIPATLPDGWVAVDARYVDRAHLGSWISDHWPDDLHIGLVQDVARAELARREATE